ncbi:hypothetical protein Tco_0212034 [Tanacetum coccineum]
MANFPNLSLDEVVPGAVPRVDKDRLLVWFNQEVLEDVARVGEYRILSCGLRDVVRKRHERIGQLKALGSCEDDIKTKLHKSSLKFGQFACFVPNVTKVQGSSCGETFGASIIPAGTILAPKVFGAHAAGGHEERYPFAVDDEGDSD